MRPQISDRQQLDGGEASHRNHFFKNDGWIAGLQHFRHESQIAFPDHSHNETSIVICTGGSLESVQMGIREVLRPGDVIITNRNIIHSSRYGLEGDASEGLALDLDARTHLSVLRELSLRTPNQIESCVFLGKIHLPHAAAMGKDLIRAAELIPAKSTLDVNRLMQQILVDVIRAWPPGAIRPMEHKTEPRLRRWDFIRGVQLMMAIDRDRFTVKSLSEEFALASSTFNKLFRNTTGISAMQLFHRILIRRACRLLKDETVSIKEVAYSLKFLSVSHFCALFRRVTGVSPKTYRATIKTQPLEIVFGEAAP